MRSTAPTAPMWLRNVKLVLIPLFLLAMQTPLKVAGLPLFSGTA